MRGKDVRDSAVDEYDLGSPPRAREGLLNLLNLSVHTGITPACAGRTLARVIYISHAQDHPRVRGKDSSRLTK